MLCLRGNLVESEGSRKAPWELQLSTKSWSTPCHQNTLTLGGGGAEQDFLPEAWPTEGLLVCKSTGWVYSALHQAGWSSEENESRDRFLEWQELGAWQQGSPLCTGFGSATFPPHWQQPESETVQSPDQLINSEHPHSHFEDIIPSNYFFFQSVHLEWKTKE